MTPYICPPFGYVLMEAGSKVTDTASYGMLRNNAPTLPNQSFVVSKVPSGTLSCPDRDIADSHRHYEGLRLLPSVCN